MAEEINKKILIQVEAETDQLKKNIADLNQVLDNLLQKQKLLIDSGQQNTKVFQEMVAQLNVTQTAIENLNKAIDNQSKAINNNVKSQTASGNSLLQNKRNMASLLLQYNHLTESQNDSSTSAKALNTQIGTLANTIAKQEEKLKKSREVFDAHKASVNALSSGFDKLKGVSGTFGPSLEEAAEGFEALKSGLVIARTGFNSVGDAIKTTGFGLLVLVLQSVVEYFTKTTEGSKKLRGAISAVGVIVEYINHSFESLGNFIVDAVTHPVESIKALSSLIKENIINRFKAFSVILDGIIHLDFKKVGDGVIQAFSGVTNATDKITNAFNRAKKEFSAIGKEISGAYIKSTKGAGKAVDQHEHKVKQSLERQIEYYKKLIAKIKETKEGQALSENVQPKPGKASDLRSDNNPTGQIPVSFNVAITQKIADQEVVIQKTALQQVEDYAKQSAGKIAADALNTLKNSIKQQTEIKIAALEKSKVAELSNSSLTSAQKLAIEQKYKKKEAEVKAKAFKQEQQASIAQAVINGALAITKGTAQSGILAELYIPAIIAETAVEVAKIASQKPPAYAKGGLHYQSDGRGGVLSGYSKTDNTNAYLRSGEGIVVSEAMQTPWARNLVSAINVGFGGRDFSIANPGRGYAVGGIFTDGGDSNRYYNQPVNDQKNLANTIAYQMINNFPPVYVDVKDVNNQQNILAQTINRVNL